MLKEGCSNKQKLLEAVLEHNKQKLLEAVLEHNSVLIKEKSKHLVTLMINK